MEFTRPVGRYGPMVSGFESGTPVLEGLAGLPFDVQRATHAGCWSWVKTDGLLLAAATVPVQSGGLAEVTTNIYRELFPLVSGFSLYRIWHFLPEINGIVEGLENYRAFCLGRHEAFFECFGEDAPRRMPAASAVGNDSDHLVIWALAGPTAPSYLENETQVPAYRYPGLYGPKPPSFARATLVSDAGKKRLFVSGTSSILGHETIAPGDVLEQTRVTISNLRSIIEKPGFSLDALADGHVTVYLRNAADLPSVRSLLARSLGEQTTRQATFLRADICRRELEVEIECQLGCSNRRTKAPVKS